jgi:hypothetical protein
MIQKTVIKRTPIRERMPGRVLRSPLDGVNVPQSERPNVSEKNPQPAELVESSAK